MFNSKFTARHNPNEVVGENAKQLLREPHSPAGGSGDCGLSSSHYQQPHQGGTIFAAISQPGEEDLKESKQVSQSHTVHLVVEPQTSAPRGRKKKEETKV